MCISAVALVCMGGMGFCLSGSFQAKREAGRRCLQRICMFPVKEIIYVLVPSKPGPKHTQVIIRNPDNSAHHISSRTKREQSPSSHSLGHWLKWWKMIELDFKWISPFSKLHDTERYQLEMKLKYVLQNFLFHPGQPAINSSTWNGTGTEICQSNI